MQHLLQRALAARAHAARRLAVGDAALDAAPLLRRQAGRVRVPVVGYRAADLALHWRRLRAPEQAPSSAPQPRPEKTSQLSSVETGKYVQEWPHAHRCYKLASQDVVTRELGMHEAVLPALFPALRRYALAATQTGAQQQRRWI